MKCKIQRWRHIGRLDKELLNYESKYTKDGVLINKLGIYDEELLNKAERMLTSYKLSKMYLREDEFKFDVSYYLSIHEELFGDIYPFAGKIRDEVIAKSFTFCLPQHIHWFLGVVMREAEAEVSEINSYDKLAYSAAHLYSDLDVVHPFREGNGRCAREFVRRYMNYVCDKNGLDRCFLNYSAIEDKNKFVDAVVKADALLDYDDLVLLFTSILEKSDTKENASKSVK